MCSTTKPVINTDIELTGRLSLVSSIKSPALAVIYIFQLINKVNKTNIKHEK